MNKNDVYKLIGYHGEYNISVKRAIRKLLKDNHPDNKGNREYFELINEVKKELESGKVSYKEKSIPKDNKDIDYDYCYQMINELKTKKNNFNEVINNKKNIITDYEKEYKDLYQKSLDLENKLLVNSIYIKKMQNIKVLSIILLVLMVIVFVISVVKNNNVFFIMFIVLSIICIFVVQRHLIFAHRIAESNKKRLTYYIKLNSAIKRNIRKQNSIKKEIRDIKQKLVNTENDLRFYKNLLK